MRIVYVGAFHVPFTTENHVTLGLEALGHEVVKLEERMQTVDTIFGQAMNSDLLLWTTTARKENPSAVAAIEMLRHLEQIGVPSASYHLDLWHGITRNGREWWKEPMFHVTHMFTVDGHMDKWKEMGFTNVHRTYPAVSPDASIGRRRKQYVGGVAFVGSKGESYHPEWPYRRTMLEHLRSKWGSVLRLNDRTIREKELNDFYASVRVVVGDSLALEWHETPYWSDRPYETTGRGGFIVMPQLDELQDHFDGWLPMYPWGDWEQLDAIIKYFLENPRDRARVAEQCYEITHARHTYTHRMREILAVIFG